MSLDYNPEEKQQINKSRELINNGKICLQICFNEIEVLKQQLKRATEEYNKHNNIINTNKNQLLRYASEAFFKVCPDDIFNIIITQITFDKHLHFYNLAISCKNLNKLINTNCYIIKLICQNKKKISFYFQKTIFTIPKLSLEQLFYKRYGKHGRSLLHLFARHNLLLCMQSLKIKYPHINPNITTIEEQWKPIHNAIYFCSIKNNYNINMIELLFNMGTTYKSKIIDNSKFESSTLFDFIDKLKTNFSYNSSYSSDKLEDIHCYLLDTLDTPRFTDLSEIGPLIDTIIDDTTICDIYNYIDKYYKYIDDIEIIDK